MSKTSPQSARSRGPNTDRTPGNRNRTEEATYVDEEGNVFQLADKGETKPIAAEEIRCGRGELETLLVASLKDSDAPNHRTDALKRGPGPYRQKKGGRSPKQKSAENGNDLTERQRDSSGENAPSVAEAVPNGDATKLTTPTPLNLRQKLAEVRRRIGYIQKRGHNERSNYSYVTAADIAGSIGDILAELGVVVIPRLEDISYESAVGRGEATRMARVVMAYTFADVDSGEEIIAKVAGQGLDPGDKAPYKAMTGALKYALLQSFLLATGDDPEDERVDARFTTPSSDRPINAEEVRELEKLIDDTGTDLERVLAYYKVASLGEMTETAYRRAVEVLNRKLAKRDSQETVHAQD